MGVCCFAAIDKKFLILNHLYFINEDFFNVFATDWYRRFISSLGDRGGIPIQSTNNSFPGSRACTVRKTGSGQDRPSVPPGILPTEMSDLISCFHQAASTIPPSYPLCATINFFTGQEANNTN